MLGPSLHALKRRAENDQLNPAYIEKLYLIAKQLESANLPTIFSLMHFAFLANVSWSVLRGCVTREEDYYSIFEIRKRSGGNRRICAPYPQLKFAQSWIHTNILKSPGALARIHKASTAYSPNSSIKKNANAHVGCAWIIKVDIKDFFESISERQVYQVFCSLGYPSLLSFEFARICTRIVPRRYDGKLGVRESMWRWTSSEKKEFTCYQQVRSIGHLPQGAPTSPMLANLVVSNLDEKLQVLANKYEATYTRYADDIVFSLYDGNRTNSDEVIKSIVDYVTHEGFRVNRIKSHVSGPGARKVVTGLIVNDVVPRLTKTTKSEIELAIYHIEKHGLLDHMSRRHSTTPLGYINHLQGLIHFARSIDPSFGAWATVELDRVLQPYSEFLQMLRQLAPPLNKEGYCKN